MNSQIQEDERQAEEDRFMDEVVRIGQSMEDFWASLKNPVNFETNVSEQSTAIERFGYNPHEKVFMIQWQSSDKQYFYPEVSAEEAADFLLNAWEAEPEPSYGKAANIFKGLHESTRVRKIRYDEAIAIIGSMTLNEVHAMVTALRDLSYIR